MGGEYNSSISHGEECNLPKKNSSIFIIYFLFFIQYRNKIDKFDFNEEREKIFFLLQKRI